MHYAFRTKTGDKELDEILLSLKGKERADFIRNALHFYIKYGNTIKNIEKDIAEIKKIIKESQSSGDYKKLVPLLGLLYQRMRKVF